MKYLLFLILVVTFFSGLTLQGQTTGSSSESTDRLVFEVDLNKSAYRPLEPIFASFRLSNESSQPIAASRPDFLRDAALTIIDPLGKSVVVGRLTNSSGGGRALPSAPSVLACRSVYRAEAVIAIDPMLLFEPGTYKLRFSLNGPNKSIRSDWIEITVIQPEGIDESALEFLQKNGSDPWFGDVFMEKTDAGTLIDFVDRYGKSIYGEYAALSLGRYYSNSGQPEKAIPEFDKVKSSSNAILARWASKGASEAEKRIKVRHR